MKLAQKMMLIPAGRTPIEYSNMSELDQAMTNVINNRNLSSLEKINLYSRLLQKNLKMEEKIKANETPVPEIPPKEAVATVKQEPVEPSKPPSKRKEKDYKFVRVKKVKKEEVDKNMDISDLFNESVIDWESASSIKSPKYKTRNNKIDYEYKYPSKDYSNVPVLKNNNNRQKNK